MQRCNSGAVDTVDTSAGAGEPESVLRRETARRDREDAINRKWVKSSKGYGPTPGGFPTCRPHGYRRHSPRQSHPSGSSAVRPVTPRALRRRQCSMSISVLACADTLCVRTGTQAAPPARAPVDQALRLHWPLRVLRLFETAYEQRISTTVAASHDG